MKFVYDWIGPKGPICNNTAPNIMQLAQSTSALSITNYKDTVDATTWQHIYSRLPGAELAASASIKASDRFIYELRIGHRWPIDTHACQPGAGLIESSHMPPQVLDGLIRGRGYLLFDNCYEAFVEDHYFQRLHDYVDYHRIPRRKVIYQTGAANAAAVYADYCQRNGIDSQQRMTVTFVAIQELKLSKSYSHLPQTIIKKTANDIQRTFLSLNRRYRQHRILLTMMFYSLGLLDKSYWSIGAVNPDRSSERFSDCVIGAYARSCGIDISDEQVNELQQLLPLKFDNIDDPNEMISDMNMGLKSWYKSSLVAVVTETEYRTNIISITEKSFKPMAYQQPYIILGAPGSLQAMRDMGYKTFGDFWDESYDTIEDHNQRLLAVGQVCKTIDSWTSLEREDFLQRVQPLLEHNFLTLRNRYSDNVRYPELEPLLNIGK